MHPTLRLQHYLVASMVAVACRREPAHEPAPRRADAAIREDVSPPTRVDAGGTRNVTGAGGARDAGGGRPGRILVYVAGGGGLVRAGAPVQIRVVRHEGEHWRAVEVTHTATVRVEPSDRGEVDRARVFRGRGRGRVEIVATLGADEARTIVDVSDELPAGVNVIPTLQASGGPAALSVGFEALPDGTIRTGLVFVGRALALVGRRTGRTFPMTVPVREEPPRDLANPPSPATGVIVLDRWASGRLAGHGTLRFDDRTVQIRFTVLLGDVTSLTSAPVAAP